MTQQDAADPAHSPPRVRLAYRVGTVGHRPKRLASDPEERRFLSTQVRRVLETVREQVELFSTGPDASLYASGAPRLVAVSSLAEGADRIMADEALDLGFELACPFPFSQETFVRDFEPPVTLEPDSPARFAALLARARKGAGLSIFELDGDYGPDTLAYARCARVVVSQADLLLAIWDGAPAAGPGGAPDSVREALAAGVPVLWIDAHAPFGWRLLRRLQEVEPLERQVACPRPPPPREDRDADAIDLAYLLRDVVQNELAPPRAGGGAVDAHMREDIRCYQDETRPTLNFAPAWKLFRDAVGSRRLSPPQFLTTDYVAQIATDWPVAADGGGAALHDWINTRLRPQYAWADKTADRYADLHRSGFVLTSFLTPLAVVAALAPLAFPYLGKGGCEVGLMIAEVVVVVWLLGLLHFGSKGRWHSRWMERRVLAELLRQLRMVTPVGGGRPRPRPRPHLSIYGDPTQSWMSWTVRAVARDLGLPSAAVTTDYAGVCLDDLSVLADGQAQFHKASAVRAETIHKRLHQWSVQLLRLTVAGVVVHFLLSVLLNPDSGMLTHMDPLMLPKWAEPSIKAVEAHEAFIDGVLVVIAAVSPALGAAFASVNNQGEFQRLAKRSEAMAAFFTAQSDAIRALRSASTPPRMAEVEPLTRRIAEAMVDEVSDWRIVMNDRALGV